MSYDLDRLGWLQFQQLCAHVLELDAGGPPGAWEGDGDECRLVVTDAGLGPPLLPARLPDPDDLPEVQRFTDWVTLYDLLVTFCPDVLDELGDGVAQRRLRRALADRAHCERERRARAGRSPVPDWQIEESRAQRVADNVIRRVLVDL